MRQSFLAAALILMVLIGIASEVAAAEKDPRATDYLIIEQNNGEQSQFAIELAVSAEEIRRGLMYRTELQASHGMLFIFSAADELRFWMKNTLIPLDMLFIRSDGVVHRIHEMARPGDLTPISSDGPVLAVLEIKGGLSRKLGIAPGDVVHHSAFGNRK